MSPQLLLVLMVGLVVATLTGLFSRRPIYYLPLYWLLSVCALLIGQEVGRMAAALLSDLGSGVTGQTVYVDMGYNVVGL